VRDRAFRVRMKCSDLLALGSSLEFNLQAVPNLGTEVVDEYVQEWMASREAQAEMQLTVTIVGATGLPNADAGEGALVISQGGSDPYCVCTIPKKKRSAVKTKVIRDNLNPIWNFEAKVPDYAAGDGLEFSVFDKDYGKPDDLLGTAKLSGKQIYPGGFQGELKLVEAIGEGNKAYLKVKARVEEAAGEADQASGVKLADKIRDATENTEVKWAVEP